MIQTLNRRMALCDPLYFFHIPKTAGTSVRRWLRELFPYHELLDYHILEELQRLPRETINEHTLFCGHFGWQLNEFLDLVPNVITWLRDPVEREISNLRYIRKKYHELVAIAEANGRDDWIKFYDFVRGATIREFIESGQYIGYSDNLQTRYLAGLQRRVDYVPIDEEQLELAKSRLASMTCFGICDWMSASVDLLSARLALPHRPLDVWLNRSSSRSISEDRLGPSDRQAMLEANRFDDELLQFARQLFCQRFAELLAEGGREESAENLKRVLKGYDQHSLAAAIAEILSQRFQRERVDDQRFCNLKLRFADAPFIEGWHPRYPDDDDGVIVRWAGPESCASIWAPLVPGRAYRVSLTVRSVASGELLQSMQIAINGIRVPASSAKSGTNGRGGTRYQVEANFPPTAVLEDQPYSRIDLHTDAPLGSFKHDPSVKVSFNTDGISVDAI